MNLLEMVMNPLLFTQSKHSKGDGWAEEQINNMTLLEFLTAISDALDDIEKEKAK